MKNPDHLPAENAAPPRGTGSATETPVKVRALADFMDAFMRASGIILELSGKEGTGANCCGMNLPGFCQIIHETHSPHIREICGNFNRHLEEMAVDRPHEARCFAGIHLTAVPLRDKQGKLGYLKTGHVMPQQPVATDFRKVMDTLAEAGVDCHDERIKEAWLAIPVMEPDRYRAFVQLLAALAKPIAGEVRETVEAAADTDSDTDSLAMFQAKRYVEKNSAKKLSLSEVANVVGLSPNYFCRKFREFTGESFTAHVAVIRIASATRLLCDPTKRIKEVAYESGFSSISQFNRVFHSTMEMSPSDYRQRVLEGNER